MNGAKKFHSPNGPAFNPGEVWRSADGMEVAILSTHRYGVDKWDVDVYYARTSEPNKTIVKGAWGFQVRYQHIADEEV
ncbi:hypothetical protein QE320_gp109 [Pseudomonas phage EM]|uniref:Uncharacterized protein n=1 Tax=Pseudomonas phage EM TaxID=2936914 RepID=A0AAE9KU02_9CAUD|nr:hypothetical protein QE320_gp109 [Pseudomonas phage EM]UPW35945.1 hypothetical protein EM_160 [Pseudomonas phage EM]